MASILIVDDDEDITANLADILSDLDYVLDVANDGEDAMRLVDRNRYDIVLLDFKMPGVDGAELYRQIKQAQPHVVAIMVTAYAGSNGVERAKGAGTWKVLKKPVDIPELLTLIDEAANQPLILLIDDDKEFCETLWQVLREHGYRVGKAFDEQSAQTQLGGRTTRPFCWICNSARRLARRCFSLSPTRTMRAVRSSLQENVNTLKWWTPF